MRTFAKSRISIHDILRILYDQIPTRYFEIKLSSNGLVISNNSYDDLLEAKLSAFTKAITQLPREEAIRYIFENMKPGKFIVFQSLYTPHFFQFGRRRHGYFLDYVVNNIDTNKQNLERTVNYLNAKGFHEVEVGTWTHRGYFFEQSGKHQCLDVYFKDDIDAILDCIVYLTVEVYKEDFRDFRLKLG